MLIDRMDLYYVRMPLKSRFIISDKEESYIDSVFLKLECEGCAGWSEAAPGNSPNLTSEWTSGVFASVRDNLLPLISKEYSIQDGDALAELFAPVKGQRYAKALFDMAYWDFASRQKGEPLWKMLGGQKKPIDLGIAFDRCDDPETFYKEIARAFEDKFRRITVKIRPGWDLQPVNAVRNESPFLIDLNVDIEGALDYNAHAEILSRLEDFLPSVIEQPLAPFDLVAHAMLQAQSKTSLSLDESIENALQAEIAIDLQACRAFCMKPGRVGGFTEAKKIHAMAEQADISCYGGFDLQSSLGYRQMLALASLSDFTKASDYLRLDEMLLEDPCAAPVFSERVQPAEGEKPERIWKTAELWDEPGLGCDPDPTILEKYTVDKISWTR